MQTNDLIIDWSDIAFADKRGLKELNATFITAPREMSKTRLSQLVKRYLSRGNLILGIAREDYVLGLEDQPQFKTMRLEEAQSIVNKVHEAGLEHKLYVLVYSQRDLPYIIDKITFSRIVFVNGSWYKALHLRQEFYILSSKAIPYDMVSPFVSEIEAKQYALDHPARKIGSDRLLSKSQVIDLMGEEAKNSCAYSEFQTGVVLARKQGDKFGFIASAYNKIVPYETYAMLYGASREKNFTPMNDLNHYDAIHAEVSLLIKAQKQKLDLSQTTLFINLLPCPSCARMLAATDIADLVYIEDHSSGYAVQLLEAAGKVVSRFVPQPRPEL